MLLLAFFHAKKSNFERLLKLKFTKFDPRYNDNVLPDLGPRVHVHPLQGDAADVEDPEHAAHPHELVHQRRQLTSLYLEKYIRNI